MEERLTGRDASAPCAVHAVEPEYLVCPVCTTRLRQACVPAARSPLEPLWQVCPYCETADRPARGDLRGDDGALAGGGERSAARTQAPPRQVRRGHRRERGRRAVDSRGVALERTLVLIKPDAVRRRPGRRDPAPIRGARVDDPCREAAHGRPRPGRAALRRARARSPSSASWSRSSPRRRRSRSCSRARVRFRSCARRWARRTRPTRRRGRSAAISRSRCRTTSCTAPTRPSRPRARSRSGSATMSSPDARGTTRRIRSETATPGTASATSTRQRNAAFIGRPEPRWGMWQLPESELRILDDLAGKDVLELGCGAAQWSILLARAGRPRRRARQLGAAARARPQADLGGGRRRPARPRERRRRAASRTRASTSSSATTGR